MNVKTDYFFADLIGDFAAAILAFNRAFFAD
jgi:hypothetical protein